jgi:2-methylcitrate dehydratase PrpD
MACSGRLDRRYFLGSAAAALLAPRPACAEATPPSRAIADFVSSFQLTDAPALALERARIAFIDTVGVMLAGTRTRGAEIVCDMVRQEKAAPESTVVGQSFRTTPQLAALADGVASHGMDYDLTYAQGQTTAALIPAILPLAETRRSSEAEIMSAYILGFEVCSRIARASPTQSSLGGWHATGTIGVIGAACAAARLLKAPATTIPDIVGIGVSLASGVAVNFGTMTKPLHAGHAARSGIMAALLGMRGFTASPEALEGGSGYFRSFARGLDWSLKPFDDLGKSYDLAERGFTLKRYPCGGLSHTAIDAMLEIRESLGPVLPEIAAIKLGATKNAALHITNRYPATIESAKFSAPYLMATTLLHGAPLLQAFTEAAIADAAVRALAAKVSLGVDPEFADEIATTPGRVTVTLADGKSIERMKRYAGGSPQSPMSAAQLREKFDDCAALSVSRDNAKRIYATLGSLGGAASLTPLWPLLRRSG